MKKEGFRRGDVFMAELRAEPGSVEHGRRPVVILQNNIGNLYAPTLIVAPITSRPRKHGCQATQYPGAADGIPTGWEHCPSGADHDDRQAPMPALSRDF